MKAYSKDIFNSCINYLESQDYRYIFDEENGIFKFKKIFEVLTEELVCTIEVFEHSILLSAKLPVSFKEDKTKALSSYIFSANENPMFAHFTIDYDTGEIYCVGDVFCSGNEVEPDMLNSAIESIDVFIKAFYSGVLDIIGVNKSSK